MRTICIVTGSRAEYGLLYWLMKEIEGVSDLALQLVVTGMHLSPAYGMTYREIEADGFAINGKVDIDLSSDTPPEISKSIGRCVAGFGKEFARLLPDLVVILGDRFELLGPAIAALIARIPVAHIAGGHVTEGAFDDAIRHSLTKMSHLHFTANETYRKRIIQLGEHPDRVFAVGSTGIDAILREDLLSRADFEQAINFELGEKNLLVTFHPATLDAESPEIQMEQLLAALDTLADARIIFTMPNADTGGLMIAVMIKRYTSERPERTVAFTSLGRKRYLSALSHVDAVVGNSSSGIIEAPSLETGTVNIGTRQKGRLRASSVIDCAPVTADILRALEAIYDDAFQESLSSVRNPYGDGQACGRILEVLRTFPLDGLVQKSFFDFPDVPGVPS